MNLDVLRIDAHGEAFPLFYGTRGEPFDEVLLKEYIHHHHRQSDYHKTREKHRIISGKSAEKEGWYLCYRK